MNTTPPEQCASWAALASRARASGTTHLRTLFAQQPERRQEYACTGAGLRLDYSRQRLDAGILEQLLRLAEDRGLEGWRTALFAGDRINSTEDRAAWHTALRAGPDSPPEVRETLGRAARVAGKIRSGAWHGATGAALNRVIHLGTGGSDLGPRLLTDALHEARDATLDIRFATNIDPLDLSRALAGAAPAATLFVVASKTFTTQETMANAGAARRWLADQLPPGADLDRHFIAITENKREASEFGAAEILPMWNWVGGRYSVWSAVSLTAMCAAGPERFQEFLAGARELDQHFIDAPPGRNLPVLLGLIGIWNINFLGCQTHAVLPYARPLRLLPAYLQQLEMESNGKQVDRAGRTVDYATAPIVWGAEGTVGQHSFHQLLHQGPHIVPSDFIVARQAAGDPERRRILAAHAEAQAEALAFGSEDSGLPPWKQYPGNRPSSTLELEALDARNLGRLLALYEHKVFVQGVIWNLNSFDQWGVELGKQLAGKILRSRPGTVR